MKNLSLFARVFLSICLGTVICLALGGYSTKKALAADPDIYKKIEEKYGVRISGYSVTSQNLNESVGEWEFSKPVKKISISTISGDYKIIRTTGKGVVVKANGKSDNPRQKILDVKENDGEITIVDPIGVSDLNVVLEIPASFTEEIEISSVSGDIDLVAINIKKLSFTTISGDVDAKQMSLAEVEGKSVSGDLKIENLSEASAKLSTTSGDIELKIPGHQKTAFEVHTFSGKVENSHGSIKDSPHKVSMSSMSGDIEIK